MVADLNEPLIKKPAQIAHGHTETCHKKARFNTFTWWNHHFEKLKPFISPVKLVFFRIPPQKKKQFSNFLHKKKHQPSQLAARKPKA